MQQIGSSPLKLSRATFNLRPRLWDNFDEGGSSNCDEE